MSEQPLSASLGDRERSSRAAENLDEHPTESRRVRDAVSRAAFCEDIDCMPNVAGVAPEYHRATCQCRLENIVSPDGYEGSADERDVRARVQRREFAQRIQDQNVAALQ
jgi:hypothetical protein